MNVVMLIGRLTRDPEIRYTQSQMAVCNFSIAVDRPVRSGEERKADFPRITVFGKQAENCSRYLFKGSMVAVQGRLQTGSYKKQDGSTVYTTDVVADRVQFLTPKSSGGEQGGTYQRAAAPAPQQAPADGFDDDMPDAFEKLEEDVPF